MARRTRLGFIVLGALAVATVVALLLVPPNHQDPKYHQFADQRTIWGVQNFWNVVSNAPFLAVALFGLWYLCRKPGLMRTWEGACHLALTIGLIGVAAGSSWYHLRPDSTTLFWDRLPMTIVFMSLLASMIMERISQNLGRWLFAPLVTAGILSVLHWKFSGDLRLYAAVQFFPLVAIPAMLLLFPPRYSGSRGVLLMCGLYSVAKAVEMSDQTIAGFVSTGGHPWKHMISALAIFCYMTTVARRRPLHQEQVLMEEGRRSIVLGGRCRSRPMSLSFDNRNIFNSLCLAPLVVLCSGCSIPSKGVAKSGDTARKTAHATT